MRDDIGQAVLDAARGWLGTPFHWEASVKGVGCDCKGLIAGAARDCGRPEAAAIEATLGGYSRHVDQAALRAGLERLFDPVPDGGDWRPGDVLLLRVGARPQAIHLALYAGSGGMIHTYSKGPQRVIEVPMGAIWFTAVVGVYRWRLLPEADNG